MANYSLRMCVEVIRNFFSFEIMKNLADYLKESEYEAKAVCLLLKIGTLQSI